MNHDIFAQKDFTLRSTEEIRRFSARSYFAFASISLIIGDYPNFVLHLCFAANWKGSLWKIQNYKNHRVLAQENFTLRSMKLPSPLSLPAYFAFTLISFSLFQLHLCRDKKHLYNGANAHAHIGGIP